MAVGALNAGQPHQSDTAGQPHVPAHPSCNPTPRQTSQKYEEVEGGREGERERESARYIYI